MDIRMLQRFVAVVEHGSINTAAQALRVAQPSLSRSLAQLEEEVGSSLFDRGPGGIAITAAGEELLTHARIILSDRDRALAAMHRLHEQAGETIAIGTDAAFAMLRLPRALARLAQSHPDVILQVEQGGVMEMLDRVREGRLSFVLGSRAPFLDLDDLVFEQLHVEGASVVMAAGHPLLAGGAPALQDLVAARWIVPDLPSVMDGWRQFFTQAGLAAPDIALRTSSLQLTKACLLEGGFVAVADHTPYADEIGSGRLVSLDLGLPRYERPAGLFRRRSGRLTDGEKALLAELRRG